ncbi:phage holin family protein, partial [Acinetobacter baumannii]|uniref:phage holin family protein n=1 Tax=Acinetobacter baumannii TaxID=470 RepID=UPI001D1741C6
LRQLTREVPSLFTKELALAKAELSESIRATKAGAASVATGGAVLLAGFIVLLMSAVYLRQLTREVPSLFTKELALAKAELSESIRATKAG